MPNQQHNQIPQFKNRLDQNQYINYLFKNDYNPENKNDILNSNSKSKETISPINKSISLLYNKSNDFLEIKDFDQS